MNDLRSSYLLLALSLLFAIATPNYAQQPTRQPNVIVIITDDQGYGDLGCHGNTIIKTPNLDKLHKRSIRLTNFHVDPTCSPSRSALMTGRYSGRVGVWHTIMGRSMLRQGEMTMADCFAASGYRTGIFGKWHLGDNYPCRPQDRGFHEVFVHGGGGVGQTPDYWGNDYFDDTYYHNGVPKKVKGYCTDVWFDRAMKFIERNKSSPFFCYLTTNAPHGPYNVAEKYRRMYEGNPKVPNAKFYGMITNIDENVGKLMAHLDRHNLTENTIVIFLTDNGTAAGFLRGLGFNAGMRGRKGSQYDGGHRVPCFIRWPAGKLGSGKDIPQLTAHLDVLPTLIDLCKLKCSNKVRFDGKSLVPLLRGKASTWPDRLLVVESQRIETPKMWRKCAVMSQRWRLIDGKELYDIQADPGQKKNIAAQNPGVLKKLRAHYQRWWKDVSRTHKEYTWIVLGSPKENPSRLTGHDWHQGNPPWSQAHIRRGVRANGFWAVEIAKAGRYEIELRRWPKPFNKALNEGPGIKAAKAKLRIAGLEHSMPIAPGAKSVIFQVNLKAGRTRLQSWLTNKAGNSRGAYYAYVRRLGGNNR